MVLLDQVCGRRMCGIYQDLMPIGARSRFLAALKSGTKDLVNLEHILVGPKFCFCLEAPQYLLPAYIRLRNRLRRLRHFSICLVSH